MMLNTLIGVLALSLMPHDPPDMKTDVVQIIEINHRYNDQGHVTMEQVIFWGSNKLNSDTHVIDFKVVDTNFVVGVRKLLCISKDTPMKYVIFEEGLGICVVKAPTLIETHTSTDPEVEDRKVLHVMYRRGLTPWPRSTVKGYQSKPLWRYLIGF